jgi:hypothetical protein
LFPNKSDSDGKKVNRNGSKAAETLSNKLFNENRRNLVKCGYPAVDEGGLAEEDG